MPWKTRATKQHLPDSTASAAASSKEGNQRARAVSCGAGGQRNMGIAPGCLNALSRDCVGSRGKKGEGERMEAGGRVRGKR